MQPDDQPNAAAQLSVGSGFSLGFVDAIPPSQPLIASDVAAHAAEVPYVLKSVIGVGGQGEVWEAWQRSLRRVVAVKIHRAGGHERFLREALLTGELDHPAIVPVLDLGELVGADGGPPTVAMAMKRLRGVRWDDLIARERPGDAPTIAYLTRHLAILESVCQAIAYAHSRGVLHLDLKPSQVIVGEFGEVYLCDWGMAARIPAEGGPLEFISPPNGPFGTPSYMAPEQALGDLEAISAATDIYLLAGLAYHVVAGMPAHRGDSPEAAITAAQRNEVAPFEGGLPRALAPVVCRAMSTAPAARYPDVESFRRALAEALQSLIRADEAATICQSVRADLGQPGLGDAALTDLERQIDRAIALSPDDPAAGALRDRTLEAHALLAIERGDLALARVVAERVQNPATRESLMEREQAARAVIAARERQRVNARRAAVGALAALAVVLAGASYFLYDAVRRVEAEQGRTAAALQTSRRELARASLQAAQSYLDKNRPADARQALRSVPAEWRGWEWGYLASAAMPEMVLHRPRTESFSALAVSSDDALIGALRSDAGELVLINRTASGRSATSVPGSDWSAVAGGAAGEILAGTSDGQAAALAASGVRWKVPCGSDAITHLAAVAGGAVYTADATGKLWLVENGFARQVQDLGGPVTVLSAKGEALAVGTASGAVWHGRGGGPLVQTTERHSAPVRGVTWSPAGDAFATWAVDSAIRQPLTDSRAIVHAVGSAAPRAVSNAVEFGLTAAAWSPDGRHLALAFSNAWLHRLDTATWAVTNSNYHGAEIATGLHYYPDGSHLVLTSRTMAQVREMQWFGQQRLFQTDSRRVVAVSPVGTRLILSGLDGGIGEWATDRDAHSEVQALAPDRVTSLDVARGSDTIAASHRWGTAFFWDTAAGLRKGPLVGRPAEVEQVRISADGSTMATIGRDGRLELARRNGDALTSQRFWQADGPLVALALHPTQAICFVAPQAGGLLMTAAPEGGTLIPVTSDPGPFTALEVIDGGATIAAGTAGGDIYLYTVGQPSAKAVLRGHSGVIRRLSLDAAGRHLVSASNDETARLWEVASGRELGVYRGSHAGPVTSALITPDGRRLLTASEDSIVRVFDRESGFELVALKEHDYRIVDMDLSPEGRRLFTVGEDTRLRMWSAVPWLGGDEFFDSGAGVR